MLPKIVITVLAMSHVRIPRNVLIKYYAEVTLSILLSLINWFGRFDGLLSFCSFLWKIHFFPLSMGVLHNHWPLTSNQSPTTILLTWLICSASQVTGFYIMEKLVVKGLSLPQVSEDQWKKIYHLHLCWSWLQVYVYLVSALRVVKALLIYRSFSLFITLSLKRYPVNLLWCSLYFSFIFFKFLFLGWYVLKGVLHFCCPECSWMVKLYVKDIYQNE